MTDNTDPTDDKVVLWSDVDRYDEEKAEDIMILGGTKPDDTCTYEKGYVKRQALYVCKTCTPNSYAGICYHCTTTCHEGHDIDELHTKRLFRCDCGNERFPTTPCLLISDKEDDNANNVYNHNFHGRYCVCDKPEEESDDTMYQCNVCEDWFHEKCIFPADSYFLQVKQNADDNEITCTNCMQQNPHLVFLAQYLSVGPIQVTAKNPPCEAITVADVQEGLPKPFPCLPPSTTTDSNDKVSQPSPTKSKRARYDAPSSGQVWLKGWRKCLCRCEECQSMLSSKKQLFLLDEEDTMAHYDNVGKEVLKEMEEKVLDDFLNKSDVVFRNNVLKGINKFSQAFSNFMTEIGNEGKGTDENPISVDDVKKFFSKLEESRKTHDSDEEDEDPCNGASSCF